MSATLASRISAALMAAAIVLASWAPTLATPHITLAAAASTAGTRG